MKTKIITVELPANEADLLAQHAAETGSTVSWWLRCACAVAGLYAPLGAIPADLPQPPCDDEDAA